MDTMQNYTTILECVDSIDATATSSSPIEHLRLVRYRPTIQPLLLEKEILRLHKYQEHCKTMGRLDCKGPEEVLETKLTHNSMWWRKIPERDTLRNEQNEEETVIYHPVSLVVEGQVGQDVLKVLEGKTSKCVSNIGVNKLFGNGSLVKLQNIIADQDDNYDLKERKMSFKKENADFGSLVMRSKISKQIIRSEKQQNNSSRKTRLSTISFEPNKATLLRKVGKSGRVTELTPTDSEFVKKLSESNYSQFSVGLSKKVKANKIEQTVNSGKKGSLLLKHKDLEGWLEPASKSVAKEAKTPQRSFKGKTKMLDVNIQTINVKRKTESSEPFPEPSNTWGNEEQRSKKTGKTKGETNFTKVIPSSKQENQMSESPISESKNKTRNPFFLSQKGDGIKINGATLRKTGSVSDTSTAMTKPVSQFVIKNEKYNIEDNVKSANSNINKLSKVSRSPHTNKHQTNENDNSEDNHYDTRTQIMGTEDENRKHPLTSPVTSPSQGPRKDAIKSSKVYVTKQWSSSNNEPVQDSSKRSFNTSHKKGSKQNKKLTSTNEFVIHYILSDPLFIKAGWTLPAVDRMFSRSVTFAVVPAHPHTYCFRTRHEEERISYPNGDLAVSMREDGTGEVYYPSGYPAVVSRKTSTGMLLYLFTDPGDNLVDKAPASVMGVFDSFGNGSLFNRRGEKTLVFNQLEGEFKDCQKKIQYKWKWRMYKVLEERRVQELLSSIVYEKNKLASIPKLDRKTTPQKVDNEKITKFSTHDPVYAAILAQLPIPERKIPKIKENKFSSTYKSIIIKVNQGITLRINGQDKVTVTFRVGKVFYSLDLGIVVDPYRVERIDEVVPDPLE